MKTCCVIVIYRANVDTLKQLCHAIVSDVGQVIVVDNTECPTLTERDLPHGGTLITLNTNTGIAHAQNIGVRTAIALGADVIAFFDQDSTIKPGFISRLVSSLSTGRPDIVSPLYVDEAIGIALPSTRVSRYGFPTKIHLSHSLDPYPVDIVISSGTVATKEVFEIVGLFDEDFFIDFVDTEWCLRCRSKDVPIRVIPSALMKSRIGIRSFNFAGTTIFVHSPLRCYYQLRNCFHLFRKRHIPLFFSVRQIISVFYSRALLLFAVDDKYIYFKHYLDALRDGILGVAGVKPD